MITFRGISCMLGFWGLGLGLGLGLGSGCTIVLQTRTLC